MAANSRCSAMEPGTACRQDPKILLMDEPSMGLSPLFVNEIFDIIKEVSASGTTVPLVEQNAKKGSVDRRSGLRFMETGKIVLVCSSSMTME